MSEPAGGLFADIRNLGACGVCEDLGRRCVDAGERCPRPSAQQERKRDPDWPFGRMSPGLLGTGPRHDRTGTGFEAARIGFSGPHALLKALTWTGCNGQTCARDCGPGHHVVLWVPCNFTVGNGHHYTLSDEEIAGLRAVLAILPPGEAPAGAVGTEAAS